MPPLVCSVMPTRRLVRGRAGAQVVIDLVDLAAQAEDQGGGDVGVNQNAAEGAAELIDIGTEGVAAAFAVREGDDAIDIGRQRRRLHKLRAISSAVWAAQLLAATTAM